MPLGTGNAIDISFVPNEVPEDRAPGPTAPDLSKRDAFIMLPVRVTGMPDQTILNGDSSIARLVRPDGQTDMLGGQIGFQIWHEEAGDGEKPITYVIRIPRNLYRQVAERTLRVEVDYSLTLLRLADRQTLPATGGNERTHGFGWCGTRVSEAGGEVLFGCIQAARAPDCASFVLINPTNGTRNHRVATCRPNYSPFRLSYGLDAMSRFTETLPFGNLSGVDLYPIKETMLQQSEVEARFYELKEYFTRRLVIPAIKLSQWGDSN